MTTATSTTTTPGQLLDHPPAVLNAPANLFGFGGLHGGLGLGLLANAMAEAIDPRPLRGIVGHFHRPMRDELEVSTRVEHTGTTSTVTAGTIANPEGRTLLGATATFGRGRATATAHGLAMPDVPSPEDCAPFALPAEIVPFGSSIDLRPATSARPFAAGTSPELTAWIRLADDDTAVDAPRLIMLLDALAPSYAAVLREIALLPTVQLSVFPAGWLDTAISPWVLVHAETTTMSADGWAHETLEAWTPDGAHLGTAHQLRLLVTP